MTDLLDGPGLVDVTAVAAEYRAMLDALEPAADITDPQAWLGDYLGEYAWTVQRQIWRSVLENTGTAVLSCNNSGKTWLAARIVVWWLTTFWRDGVRIVTTAPTAAQVSLLLWQEVRAAYQRAKDRGRRIPGRIIGSPFPQWKVGDEVVAFGRKPADHEQSAMQGVHAPHVLVVLDEAGGVAKPIWDAADKITTTGHARILAIGNPDDLSSPFGAVTRPGSGWRVIHVDGLRTPNMTADRVGPLTAALMAHEGIPYSTESVPDHLRPVMLSPAWVEERFTRWCGVPNNITGTLTGARLGAYLAERTYASQLFMASVRGQFTEATGHSVIPYGWAIRAVHRWRDWVAAGRPTVPGRLVLGVDVATANGADDTVIVTRTGDAIHDVHVYPEADTVQTVENVLEHAAEVPQAIAVVDAIGVGTGVADLLARKSSLSTVRFIASQQSGRTDRSGEFGFYNDRAAAWWRMRELLDPAYGARLMLPDDEQLLQELTAPRWWIRRGITPRIQVEEKAEVRRRLGHSTDRGDGAIQSVWIDGAALGAAGGDTAAIPYGKALPAGPDGSGGAGMVAYELGGSSSVGGDE